MKAKQFLFLSLSLFIALFCAYVLLFYVQLGAPLEAEWWVNDMYNYKDYKARNIASKKIIIIGGSNVLFGINSQVISQQTGYPVINLGTHGGLDIDFLYYKIKQHIQEGDIVVLPLEFEYYTKTGEVSEWFSQNMQAWGRDYLKQLPLKDVVKIIISAEPGRVLSGVEKRITSSTENTKTVSEEEVLKQLKALWVKEGPKWRGHSFKSLNKDGDVNVENTGNYTKDFHYLKNNIDVTPHFIKIYRKIERLVTQYHGSLYLTYPVTVKNKFFDLSDRLSIERIAHLENNLKQHDIIIQCNAALFNLNKVYFFDNHYHPDKHGALIRSYNLSDCLNRLSTGLYQKITYTEAVNQTNLFEKEVLRKEGVKAKSDM